MFRFRKDLTNAQLYSSIKSLLDCCAEKLNFSGVHFKDGSIIADSKFKECLFDQASFNNVHIINTTFNNCSFLRCAYYKNGIVFENCIFINCLTDNKFKKHCEVR